MNSNIAMFVWGLIFSIGLGLSGMTQPSKVVGFLDFIGDWDPSMILVMAGAVTTYFTLSRLVLQRSAPVLLTRFSLPTRIDIDGRLVAGSALFGVGWGMVGFCPGPALTSIFTGNPLVLIFVLSMSVGMYLYGAIDARYTTEDDGGAGALDIMAAQKKS